MFELAGKTALATGATKRIGNAIAVGLAKQGSNVIIHYDRSEREAKKLRDEIVELGFKSWLVKANLEDSEPSRELIEKSHRLAGEIDVPVNNASVFSASARYRLTCSLRVFQKFIGFTSALVFTWLVLGQRCCSL